MRMLLLLALLVAVPGSSCAGAASPWQSFAFDGKAFVRGMGDGAVLVRDGYLPVPAGAGAPREDRLPDGMGAVALFCFRQSSGGKLRAHGALAPMAGVAITVSGSSLDLAARTDASGYLILALPPGNYELRLAGFAAKVTVASGKTALAAVRGGKRMVD